VEPEKYIPRLLHLKEVVHKKDPSKKKHRMTEVPLNIDSLNSADVFILDKGLDLFIWNGKNCPHTEKFKAS